MSKRETDFYRFDGLAGEHIFFDSLNGDPNNNWKLYSGRGVELNSAQLSSNRDFEQTLPYTGEYFIGLNGSNRTNNNYSFELVTNEWSTNNYTIGEAISGAEIAIDEPGDRDNYTFDATAGDILYFDALENTNTNINWKLIDFNGKEIFDEDAKNDRLIILTRTGEYTLNFDGVGSSSTQNKDIVDSYGFQVLNWSNTTAIDKDEVINGDFSSSKRETDFYRFNGVEGERIFFNSLDGDFGNFWGLYTNRGVRLESVRLSGTTDFEITLPYTGEYFIDLEGNNRNNNNYSFELVTNEWSTIDYTIGETIVGEEIAIDEPGDRDNYTFEATAGDVLYFDALENSDTDLNWKLTDSNDDIVFNEDAVGDRLVTISNTGRYTLNFDSAGDFFGGIQQGQDAMGSYGFRIFDWSEITTVNFDELIVGDFGDAKRETDLYHFSAEVRQKLFFNRFTGNSFNNWSLYDKRGVAITDSIGLSSDFEFTIPATDDYILLLEGKGSSNNDYSFEIVTSGLSTTTLTLGETITNEITQIGQEDTYTFTGIVGQKLFFDTSIGQSNIEVKLYSPSGQLILDRDTRTSINSAPFNLTETGNYRLVINGNDENTGNYSFNLKDIATETSLDLAAPINGSLSDGRATDLYRIDGTKGQVLNFNLEATRWSGASWILYDSAGQELAKPSVSSPDFQVTLPADGTYTLAVIGNSNDPVDYSFEATDVTPSSIVNTGLDTTVSGTLAAGEVVNRSFSASAGTHLFIDSLNNSNSRIRLRLVDPNGSNVFDNQDSRFDRDVIVLPQTGEYNLQVYGSSSGVTGNYSFQLLELPQNTTGASNRSLPFDTIISGTLSPGLEANVYSFFGKVGQQILFNGMGGDNVTTSLYAPNGSFVFSLSNYRSADRGIHTLAQDGVYYLILGGEQTANRDYSFQMLDFGFGTNISFNQTISGSLSSGRQSKLYKLTAQAGDRLYFDSISGSRDIRLKIYEPGNYTILKNSTLDPNNNFEVDLPVDGTYTIYLEGGGSSTPVDYSFQPIIYKPDSSVIVPGTGENANANDGSLGLFPVKLGVSDDVGAIGIQEYQIRLLPDPDNTAPIIISTPNEKYGVDREAYRYQVEALDPDEDALTYRLVDSPLGALIDRETGELIWFPNNVAVGQSYEFTVEVVDGRGGITSQSFSVEVSEALGKIQGLVFDDLNNNGIPDTKILQGDNPDIFFVIDTSGSMGGRGVDWLTANIKEISQRPISPLDQELGSIVALAEFAIEQGLGNDVRFGIAGGSTVTDMNPFEPGIQVTIEANADNNNNGILDIREVIALGVAANGSDTGGLRTAAELHKALLGDPNIVFMSDGFIRVDRQLVADVKAQGVNVTAFGFAEGGMDTMRLVDPNAVLIESPQEIIDIFSGVDPRFVGEPLMEGVTVYLDTNDNGTLDEGEPSQITRVDNSINRLERNNFTFTFDNLLPGTHTLRQIVPNGYTQTAPDTDSFIDTITVDEGETFTHLFGNHLAEPLANNNPNFTSLVSTDSLETGELFKYQATATDIDGDKLDYELTLAPDGMVADPDSGIVVWQPTANQTGTAQAILRVNDGEGGVDIQYFELNVNAPNLAPVFTSFLAEEIKPQVGKLFSYRATAVDGDNDPLTYELVAPVPTGVAIDADTGLVTWTPGSNQLGENEITIKVTDGKGGETTQTLTLEIIQSQANRPPEFTSTPRNNIQIGTNYFYQPTVVDPDGDALSFNLLTAPDGMVIDLAGRIIWSPTVEQFGIHTVELEVNDSVGGFAVQNWDIRATDRASNSLPSITSTPVTRTNVDKLYTYQATATDPDGDYLFWSLDNAPSGMAIDPNTGILSWQPQDAQIGVHTVAIGVTDALGASVTQEFTLSVTGVNTAPNIISTPITNGAVDNLYTYRVAAIDPERDTLVYNLGLHPVGMKIDESTGLVSWTPESIGSYEVEVIAIDAQGASNRQLYTLEIGTQAINNAPVINSTPGFLADVNSVYSYQVEAEDSDGDILNYSLIEAPSGMNIDESTGLVTWNSPLLGTYQIVIGVNDGKNGVAQGYTITVRENLPPVIDLSNPPNPTAIPQEEYRYDVPVFDPNGDPIIYTLDPVSIEKGIIIDELGRLSWTPEPTDGGNHPVTITISDETGASVEQNFNISVVADIEAPLVTLLPGNIFIVDEQYQADLNSTIPFQVRATDNVGVTGLQLLVDNVPVQVDGLGIADVTFNKLGIVELRALAYDAAGNIGETSTTVEIFDSSDVDAPFVELDLSHIPDNIISSPTEIIGTVNDDNLTYYVLEYAVAGTDDFVELNRGNNNFTDSIVDTFDPSVLANEAYTLRLTGFDVGGNFAKSEETIYVEGELKLGNFQLSFTDLSIPVSGIPVNLTRTYDTLTANSRDDFGFGWRLEFRDTNLRTSVGTDEQFDIFGLTSVGFREGDKVYITLPGGQRETYTFKPQLTKLGAALAGLAGSAGQAAGGKDFGLYEPAFVSESDSNNELKVGNFLLIREESGQFAGIAGGLYNPANAAYGGKYTLVTGEGIEYEIDAVTGDLLTATDTNENKLTFSEAGILSDTGVEVRFGRDGQGRITNVIDPEGNEIIYDYDDNGDLIAVTDREKNTTRYGYNEERAHYLDEIIDPLGRPGVRTEYDENGRLSRVIDVDGEAVELSYDPDNSVQTTKDVFGNETTYVYDERGNVIHEVDALGGITKRTFDNDDNILTQTDPEGNTYTYTYDAQNNLTSATDPLENTEYFTFNRFHEALTKTDSLGNTTSYVYDQNGNRISFINAEGEEIKYSFDNTGNVTKITNPKGESVEFEYDLAGNVTRKIDEQGNETTYTYDADGNQLTESKAFMISDGLQTQTQSWTYDEEGRVVSFTNFVGQTIRHEYDANDNLIVLTDSSNQRTEYKYDEKGRLIETVYPDDSSEKTIYDAMDREIETVDAAGYSTYYTYDALGRLIETILPDNTPEDLTDNPRTKSEYDKSGRVVAQIDELGNRTEYKYDAVGRRVSQKDALGNEIFYTYDSNGNRVTETNALGEVTIFVYDALSRPIETIYADGTKTITKYNDTGLASSVSNQKGQITYYYYDESNQLIEVIHPDDTPAAIADNPRIKTEYDELGRVTASIDELGNRTEYEYDAAGRQTLVRDARGNETTYTYDDSGNLLTETNRLGHTTRYKYDELDRPIKTIFHDDTSTTTTYDKLGREIATTDQEGKTTQYEYDPLGRLTAVIDAAEQRTEYTYDLAGNLAQIKDANNNITKHEYDALNRRTTTILPLGQRSTTVYDEVGNVTSLTNFDGETIEYEYDALNRLTSKQFLDDTSIDYTYTLTGQVKTITDLWGTTSYDYDVRDRLIEQINPDSQFIRYTYDAASNRTGVITSSDTVTYTYNPNNQPETVASSLGETSYSYDAAGNLVQTLYPNNTAEIRTYDDLNRLTFLKNVTLDPDTGTETSVISSYDYTLDKVGNRLAVTEDDGRRVNYDYDDLYRLTQERINDDGTVRTIDYTYDPIGNRLSRNDSELGLTTYAYNNNDWLLTEETNGAVTTYTYDDNWNTLSEVNSATNEQTVYTWDDENRLIGAEITTDAGTTVTEYEYNADGVRVASIVDGVEIRYLVDSNLQYAQVLEEYTPEGNVEVAYVRGHDLISQVRNGEVSFYHLDGLGSTRALTNGDGNVTDVYIYDAYGNVINSSGSTENNYLYTGEQYDPQLQDYYLRARYYNPSTGRFTARDPFEGFLTEPLSLAKYPYVHGNPVNATDPSGLLIQTELATATAIGNILAVIYYAYSTPLARLRPSKLIPDEVIDGNDVVRRMVDSPISIANTIRVMVAEEEMEWAALFNYEPNNLGFPYVVWGREYQDVFQHDYDALHGMGDTINGNGLSPAFLAYINPGWNRTWLGGVLASSSSLGDRDEYPYASVAQGGEFNYNLDTVSVRYVNASRNRKQGNRLGRVFYPTALTANHPFRSWFGVLTLPTTHNSYWVDRRGNTHPFRPV